TIFAIALAPASDGTSCQYALYPGVKKFQQQHPAASFLCGCADLCPGERGRQPPGGINCDSGCVTKVSILCESDLGDRERPHPIARTNRRPEEVVSRTPALQSRACIYDE